MVQCAGCNQEFSASGYTMHIARTTTSICRAAYNQHFQAALTDNQVDDIDVDMDATGSQRFEGDFFGNYQEVDFDWPQDDEKDTVTEMVEEDMETEEEDDPGMDFGQTTHMLRPPSSVDMPSEQAGDTRGAPQSEAQSSRPLVHSEAQPTPSPTSDYIVEAFPGDTTGMPLEFTTTCQSMFEHYQQQLNSDAVYAPFALQTDWEIARWAKIHGPSSSAFNELLQIDGVSLLFCPPL
jgi:hypothetical protein